MYSFSDLAGKRVLVTGGSAGIGKAIALAFSGQGAVVTIVARSHGAGSKMDETVSQFKTKGFGVAADIGHVEQCTQAVKNAIELMGGLDIVVNNGGIGESPSGPGDNAAAFLEMCKMHVVSAAVFIEAALPELTKNKGVVVNISSSASQMAFPMSPEYGGAKSAQDHLTRSLALKYAAQGVRVNAVAPGPVHTEALVKAAESFNAGVGPDEFIRHIAASVPMQRVAKPEEIAPAVLFLCSNAASYITGTVVTVDGGQVLPTWMTPRNGVQPEVADGKK